MTNERQWRRRARLVAGRLNAAWWLGRFLPAWFGATLALAAGLLVVRNRDHDPAVLWLAYGAIVMVGAGLAAILTRRRWCSTQDALVRLETVNHLHNRLTSAAAGIGDWPPILWHAPDGYRWRWRQVLWPPLASASLLGAAWWWPLKPAVATAAPTQEPLAWQQLAGWIEHLQKNELVQPEALAALQERLAALRHQPRQDWYSHSSLEAGDHLREQAGQMLQSLEQQLGGATSALTLLQQMSAALPPELSQMLQQQLGQAMQGLAQGDLPLNPELLARLRDLLPDNLGQLTPEQAARLLEQLRGAQGQLPASLGGGQPGELLADAMALLNQPGSGGLNRGPGEAPLTWHPPPPIQTGRDEALTQADLTQPALGDTVGTSADQHRVDETQYRGPIAGGDVAAYGVGGETVWRTPLRPAERGVLRRYFE